MGQNTIRRRRCPHYPFFLSLSLFLSFCQPRGKPSRFESERRVCRRSLSPPRSGSLVLAGRESYTAGRPGKKVRRFAVGTSSQFLLTNVAVTLLTNFCCQQEVSVFWYNRLICFSLILDIIKRIYILNKNYSRVSKQLYKLYIM